MGLKNRSYLVTAALLFGSGLISAQGGKVSPLDAMYSYSPEYKNPIWVSARDLAASPDRIAWEKLLPSDRELVEKRIERQRSYRQEMEAKGRKLALLPSFSPKIADDLCLETLATELPYSGKEAPTSFEGLVRQAEGIIEAKIEAVEPGLFLSAPASLLQVRVTRTFRPLREHKESSVYYVYHSFARFSVGGYSFCNARSTRLPGDPRKGQSAFEPEVGGRVLLFVFGQPLDRDGLLIAPLEDQVLYESPKGKLVLSDVLSRDDELHPAKSLDEIEAMLEVALKKDPLPKEPVRPPGSDAPRSKGLER